MSDGVFRCDYCDQTWPHGDDPERNMLRSIVASHLAVVHGITGQKALDSLPMTPDLIAWVRAQRSPGVQPPAADPPSSRPS